MKKLYSILAVVLFTASVFAQSPEKMSYQSVVRDASNNLITNTQVGLQVRILQDSATGTEVYSETQTPTTNDNGLLTVEIGGQTGFDTISWVNGPYFIETSIDPAGGTNYTITGTSQLLSVPYALHANFADSVILTAGDGIDINGSTISEHKYQIGDFAQGGIVFWVDETGEHGLVCAKEDQSSGIRWYAGTYGVTRATGNAPLAGELNTSIIISSQVAIGDDGNDYAAQICNDLYIAEGGKVYGDWYLPSTDELTLMYQNKTIINSTAQANGGSSLNTSGYYWSSTEYSSQAAYRINFLWGISSYEDKNNTYYVRAVRAF